MRCSTCGFQSFDRELYLDHTAGHMMEIIEGHLATLPPEERKQRIKAAHDGLKESLRLRQSNSYRKPRGC